MFFVHLRPILYAAITLKISSAAYEALLAIRRDVRFILVILADSFHTRERMS